MHRIASKVALEDRCISRPDEEEPMHEVSFKEEAHSRNRTDVLGFAVPLRLLPATLLVSTVLAGVFVLVVQLPLLGDCRTLGNLMAGVYAVTLALMVRCMTCDPGQLPVHLCEAAAALPRRTHKAWTHDRPIRRYDHYCRWLTNPIGLLNHREFLSMLAGLVALSASGALIDLALLLATPSLPASGWSAEALHLVFCALLLRFVFPIFRMHIGFVHRNELCCEWREDLYYRVSSSTRRWDSTLIRDLSPSDFKRLDNALVRELLPEDYNELDSRTFRYDPSENPFDKGWQLNWWNFWCLPRWSSDQLGEF